MTEDEVNEILHYCHWIPALRGFSGKFIASTYPGYSLDSMLELLKSSGALVKDRNHFSGWKARKKLPQVIKDLIPVRPKTLPGQSVQSFKRGRFLD